MLKLCNSINDRISISDVKKQFANGISSYDKRNGLFWKFHGLTD